jgi:hypothetical protein
MYSRIIAKKLGIAKKKVTRKTALCFHLARIAENYLTFALSPKLAMLFRKIRSFCPMSDIHGIREAHQVRGVLSCVLPGADEMFERRYPGWIDFADWLESNLLTIPCKVDHPFWQNLMIDYTTPPA